MLYFNLKINSDKDIFYNIVYFFIIYENAI